MATNVRYNGVLISNCVTRHFDQQIEYDASGTDMIGVRYRLTFEGYVHSQAWAGSFHGIQALTGGNALPLHLQFDRISTLLTEPRRLLEVFWEDQPVLRIGPYDGRNLGVNTDVENGPKPFSLEVVSVTPQAVRIRWTVSAVISFCADANQRKGPYRIINNRWSISESRNSDFYTTRTIQGTIRFAEGLSPKHAFVAAVVPGLEKGFRRESFEYEVAPNGLEATYRVVDQQVHYAAPWPATSMDVQHMTSTNDGMSWVDEVHVTLTGSPEADRRQLLTRMIQIIDQRVDFLARAQDSDRMYLIENVVITEHFGQVNTVQAIVTVRHMAQGPRVVLGNILEKKLGQPLVLPNYDPALSRVPALHGYNPHGGAGSERSPSYLFLLTCFYQDPCSQVKTIFGASPPSTTEPSANPSLVPAYPTQVPQGTLPRDQPDQILTRHHFEAIYTFVKATTEHEQIPLQFVLPCLGPSDQEGRTAVRVALGPGHTRTRIRYEAQRLGRWPLVPILKKEWSFKGRNEAREAKAYLEALHLHLDTPRMSTDGNKLLFSAKVEACYAWDRVLERSLPLCAVPHLTFKEADALQFDQQSQARVPLGENFRG